MKQIVLFTLPILAAASGVGGGFVARAVFSGDKPAHAFAEDAGKSEAKHNDKHEKPDSEEYGKKDDKNKSNNGKNKPSASRKKPGPHSNKEKDKKDYNNQGNYMKFSRQFVIPLIKDNEVVSMLIMDINLEMNSDARSDYYIHEPKMRDALMSGLLALAQRGVFFGDIGAERNVQYIKEKLLEDVKTALGKGVEEVLIMDMVRQDI